MIRMKQTNMPHEFVPNASANPKCVGYSKGLTVAITDEDLDNYTTGTPSRSMLSQLRGIRPQWNFRSVPLRRFALGLPTRARWVRVPFVDLVLLRAAVPIVRARAGKELLARATGLPEAIRRRAKTGI